MKFVKKSVIAFVASRDWPLFCLCPIEICSAAAGAVTCFCRTCKSKVCFTHASLHPNGTSRVSPDAVRIYFNNPNTRPPLFEVIKGFPVTFFKFKFAHQARGDKLLHASRTHKKQRSSICLWFKHSTIFDSPLVGLCMNILVQ